MTAAPDPTPDRSAEPSPASGRSDASLRPPEHRLPRTTVLYVAGLGRSGSTILGGALGQGPGRAGVGEVMRFFERGLVRDEPCSCGCRIHACEFWGPVVESFRRRILGNGASGLEVVRAIRRVTEGWRAPGAFLGWPGAPERVRSLAAKLYERVRQRAGDRVLVDTSKNPVWLKLLVGLSRIDVHVLHLVRDSRGVAHSFLKKRTRNGREGEDVYMYRHPAVVTAVGWSLVNTLVRRVGRRARSYRLVRYEDFVRAPHEVLGIRVGESGREDATREEPPAEGRCADRGDGAGPGGAVEVDFGEQHIVAGNPVRLKEPPVRIVQDRVGEDGLSPLARSAVTAATAPGLARYGYLGSRN